MRTSLVLACLLLCACTPNGTDTAADTDTDVEVEGCDWSDVAGNWTGTVGSLTHSLAVEASAAYDAQIAVNRIETGGSWCEIGLTCKPDAGDDHLASSAVTASGGLGCVTGWYRLRLSGDDLVVKTSENEDGTGMGGTLEFTRQ